MDVMPWQAVVFISIPEAFLIMLMGLVLTGLKPDLKRLAIAAVIQAVEGDDAPARGWRKLVRQRRRELVVEASCAGVRTHFDRARRVEIMSERGTHLLLAHRLARVLRERDGRRLPRILLPLRARETQRVERQRLVHHALGDLLHERVHALSIKARAPGA